MATIFSVFGSADRLVYGVMAQNGRRKCVRASCDELHGLCYACSCFLAHRWLLSTTFNGGHNIVE